MITNKLKSLLALRGLAFADYARKLEILPQSLQTRTKTDAYKIKDLIAFGELTSTNLAFVDEAGKILIEFNRDDLIEKGEERWKKQ